MPPTPAPLPESAADPGPPGVMLDQWWAEYLSRLDRGPVDRQQFLAECPEELREPLRGLLETADLVDEMAGAQAGLLPSSLLRWTPEGPERRRTARGSYSPPPAQAGLQDTVSAGPARTGEWGLEPLAGQTLGDYELLEEIGRGGMGVVFKARQISLAREVAVKMILAGRFASQEDVQRFLAEAQAAGRVDHPNIVTVYQVGQVDGHHFFSMDYIEGPSLADLCRQGPLAPRRAATYLLAVAEAVEAAHKHGILHRDLKPANILIDKGERACVSDFGLAKTLAAGSALTNTGAAIGTPSYMPPEQARGDGYQIGPASDVYSLGAILYVMLTGQPPFAASTAVETIYQVVHRDPVPPRRLHAQADPVLETICLKCLAKDPEKRYRTAQELADDLHRYLQGQPVLAQPAGMLESATRWTLGIPVVAALLGRQVPIPTPAHQRAQAALILAAMACVVALVLGTRLAQLPSRGMPTTIRIASGRSGGVYWGLCQQLIEPLERLTGSQVQHLETSGSVANSQLLRDEQVELALVQAAALRGDEARVVAPVCYEVVHVIVRADRAIDQIEQLRGRRIALGPAGSGSRLTADTVVRFYKLQPDPRYRDRAVETFLADTQIDGAIATIGPGAPYLLEALASGQFRLLPLIGTEEIGDRTLEPHRIAQAVYPQAIASPEGLPTLKTPAFLVANPAAPQVLVQGVLEALYGVDNPQLIPPATAATWTFLPWHRGARQYFDRYRP